MEISKYEAKLLCGAYHHIFMDNLHHEDYDKNTKLKAENSEILLRMGELNEWIKSI